MIADIKEMHPESRIWIYQASREITDKENELLKEKVPLFLQNWETHGHPLKTSWNLLYNRFLILAVDQQYSPPSGCSIDASVRFVRELEETLGIGFLEKTSVAILSGNDRIETYPVKDLRKQVEAGNIKPETIVFNNLVDTLADLDASWRISASQSWLSRYFNN